MEDFFSILVLILLFLVIVFLIGRHLFCWYWKINARVSLLENISSSVRQINSQLDSNKQLLDAINNLNTSLASIGLDITDIKKLSDAKSYVPTSLANQIEDLSNSTEVVHLTDGINLGNEYVVVQDELPEI